MNGDFSRFTHQPGKHYAGVMLQQGRVQLDADWNEQRDIDADRWRCQTIDTIGACGAPKHTAGFAISLADDGNDLLIGTGRIYVGGLLYSLEAPDDAAAVNYSDQPDLPAPLPAPLQPEDGRTDLVFLDVWQRHVTAVEDPYLREVALGGPDTTTRVQTVAQVKVLQGVGDIRCNDDLTDWDDLVRPSDGRMSARSEPAPVTVDPCRTVPGGGLRGIENRLYRVEILTEGALGTATFVWSGDNGSVLAPVEQFIGGPNNQIRIASIGRDQTLRFKIGDRVEVLSDHTELAGNPGTMARIDDIDETQRTLSLSTDVSAHASSPHPKVRRWDQQTDPIKTTAAWIDIDDGVEVKFSAGPFKTGDYWVIPARTATDTVEGFTNEPPRGINHYFCRLALVTWSIGKGGKASAGISDCRELFPPLTELPSAGTCCTVTVGDGVTSEGDVADIQTAVDGVVDGGRICLLPGQYQLAEPIVIKGRALTIYGCGGQASIVAPAGTPALLVDGGALNLRNLSVQADAAAGTVLVGECDSLDVRDCELANHATGGPALVVVEGTGVNVVGCRLAGQPAVSLQALQAHVEDNHVVEGGIWLRDGSADVDIRSNEIAGGRGPGVALGGLGEDQEPSPRRSGAVRIAVIGNRIKAMTGSGITTFAGSGGDQPLADVRDLTIAWNEITSCAEEEARASFDAEAVGGIILRNVATVRIHDNLIAGNGGGKVPACGIFVHTCHGLTVRDNTIVGNGAPQLDDEPSVYQAGVVALLVFGGVGLGDASLTPGPVEGELPAAMIHDNVVVNPWGHALMAVGLGPISVADNTLTAHGVTPQPLEVSRVGAAVFVIDLGRTPILSDALIGFGTSVGTVVAQCASGDDTIASPAVAAQLPLPDGRVSFHGNQVTFRAPVMDVDPPTAAVALASLDAVALMDNQVLCQIDDGMIWAGTVGFAPTMQASGNRFTETPCRAAFSLMSFGLANITSDNQATHCVSVFGTQVVDRDNQVLLADCERIGAALARGRS